MGPPMKILSPRPQIPPPPPPPLIVRFSLQRLDRCLHRPEWEHRRRGADDIRRHFPDWDGRHGDRHAEAGKRNSERPLLMGLQAAEVTCSSLH